MLKKYAALSKAAWGIMIEYRAQIVLWMLSSLLMIVMLMVWLGISANGAVNGFSSGDFIAYFMIGWVVRIATAVWSAWELDYAIRQGTLSPLLLRPIHPIHNEIAANLTEKILRMAILLPIVLTVLAVAPVTALRLDAFSLLAFALALAGAWLLVFLTDYLVGMLSFWTSQTSAFIHIFYGLRLVLSGIIAPLAMFPTAVQSALRWSPFPYMLNFPTTILTKGLPPGDLLFGFAAQWLWIGAAAITLRLVWRLAMRSYSAVGA